MSAYDVTGSRLASRTRSRYLAQWDHELLARPAPVSRHVDASLQANSQGVQKFYSDGVTTATQQRVRLHPQVTAVAISDDGRFSEHHADAGPAPRPGL